MCVGFQKMIPVNALLIMIHYMQQTYYKRDIIIRWNKSKPTFNGVSCVLMSCIAGRQGGKNPELFLGVDAGKAEERKMHAWSRLSFFFEAKNCLGLCVHWFPISSLSALALIRKIAHFLAAHCSKHFKYLQRTPHEKWLRLTRYGSLHLDEVFNAFFLQPNMKKAYLEIAPNNQKGYLLIFY